MSIPFIDCPPWATVAYGDVDINKWTTKRRHGTFLFYVSCILIVVSVIAIKLTEKKEPEAIYLAACCLGIVFGLVTFVVSRNLAHTGLKTEQDLNRRWHKLQEEMGMNADHLSERESAYNAARVKLLELTVQTQIAHLSGNPNETKTRKDSELNFFFLLVRFGIEPDDYHASDQKNIFPFGRASKEVEELVERELNKMSTSLYFAKERFRRQRDGLPT